MLIKPEHCLQKSLLLGISHQSVRKVSTDGKSVRNSGIEIDLVWNI
jgi:hypothetical protein